MGSNTVAVIDYGMGNLHSVASALKHVDAGCKVEITADPDIIRQADRILFPGVGAIRDCMAEIKRLNIDKVIAENRASGTPILAICVGLQALMQRSEENDGVDCLSVFPGAVKSFAANPAFQTQEDESAPSHERLKVPHMGWNQVAQVKPHPLWADIPDNSRFYFVHSFYVDTTDQNLVSGKCHYGIDFNAALSQDNVFAAQFHPEKSHTHGLQLLANFLKWDGVV